MVIYCSLPLAEDLHLTLSKWTATLEKENLVDGITRSRNCFKIVRLQTGIGRQITTYVNLLKTVEDNEKQQQQLNCVKQPDRHACMQACNRILIKEMLNLIP